jgi:hypothetical protein
MHRYLTLLAFSAFLPSSIALANDSAYTDVDFDACQKLSEDEVGVALKCEGLKGYAIYFKEGDLRQSVSYGPLSKAYIDGAFESFTPFNRTGSKVEWRLDPSGKPVAAILRYFLENPDPETGASNPKLEGQVLVISRVAQEEDGKSCVAGYVDALANRDANILARKIADDIAPSFICGKETPVYHGTRGPRAAEPGLYLPEEPTPQ